MVDQKSTLPPVHSRKWNNTALYEKACPDCGSVTLVDKRRLNKPCHPCAMKRKRTHGLTAGSKWHPLYTVLASIKTRCKNPSAPNYRYYGGRGIYICQEWDDDPKCFVDWAEANGWRRGLDIDRIDNDGPYSPENCHFITRRENSQKRSNQAITPDQVRRVRALLATGMKVRAVSQAVGVHYMCVWHLKNSPGAWSNI